MSLSIGERDLTVDVSLSPTQQRSLKRFVDAFQSEHLSARFTPTDKQLRFVNHYLKTGDPAEAYEEAGYFSLSKHLPYMRRLAWWRVLHSKNVQILLRMAMWQWANKHKVSPSAIANRLLHIADTADDLQTRVSALRELNCMLGYHKDMGQKLDVPSRKKKKRKQSC